MNCGAIAIVLECEGGSAGACATAAQSSRLSLRDRSIPLPAPAYAPAYAPPSTSDARGRVTKTLGPVGIAFGQTLRVTFLNLGSNPLEIVPCVFDGDGAHLKTGERLTLAPGQMRSLEISWSEAAGGRTETRVQMRGAAHVDRSDAKNLVMAGEVVEDAGGRSSLYVPPGTRKGFDPQPDPPAAR